MYVLRRDRGLEFMNKDVEDLLRDYGVKHETSQSYTPEQNGVIERDNQTVLNWAKSIIQPSGFHKKFWAEAVNTAVYLLNRTPNKRLKGTTSFELWHRFKPDDKLYFKKMMKKTQT